MQGANPGDALAVAGALEEPDNEDRVPGHLLVYCSPDDEQRFQHDWNALRHELASVDINLLPDGALPRLAVTVGAGNGINLLQGRYGANAEIGALFRPWRYAAALLLTLGVLAFGGKAADYYRLTHETNSPDNSVRAGLPKHQPERPARGCWPRGYRQFGTPQFGRSLRIAGFSPVSGATGSGITAEPGGEH